jgi:hypothetical protein
MTSCILVLKSSQLRIFSCSFSKKKKKLGFFIGYFIEESIALKISFLHDAECFQ